jgi:hypothetical protein
MQVCSLECGHGSRRRKDLEAQVHLTRVDAFTMPNRHLPHRSWLMTGKQAGSTYGPAYLPTACECIAGGWTTATTLYLNVTAVAQITPAVR